MIRVPPDSQVYREHAGVKTHAAEAEPGTRAVSEVLAVLSTPLALWGWASAAHSPC